MQFRMHWQVKKAEVLCSIIVEEIYITQLPEPYFVFRFILVRKPSGLI